MESYREIETPQNVEDVLFHREAAQLRKALESRQRWSWLPWRHAEPSSKEKIYFKESRSALITPRRCWQVQDENLYLAEHGGILYRDENGALICPLSFREHDPRIVFLTEKMRQMRENL